MMLYERMQQKMDELGLKQADIARATGNSTAAVTKWMRGENIPKAAALKAIAQLLEVNADWLLTGKGSPRPSNAQTFDQNVRPAESKFLKVPVLDFVQAGNWRAVAYDGVTPMDYTYITYKGAHPTDIFALIVDGDSMTPEFYEGDMIVVDTQKRPTPGCYVVAQNGEVEATFKKYRVTGYTDDGDDVFELIPLNDDYPTLRSDRQHIDIIGVVIQHVRSL